MKNRRHVMEGLICALLLMVPGVALARRSVKIGEEWPILATTVPVAVTDALVRAMADDASPPAEPVKLIFIHHSTGGNWLADEIAGQSSGGLGQALMENNYFVNATNYGWGPYSIGDRTDIPDWPEWFTGPNRDEIMSAVYTETGQNIGGFGDWSRLTTDPGGENEIVMFKSCFPNSDLYGNPDDPPRDEPNDQYTVANAKAVYNEILTYFATRQDKLFVVITAPPLMESATAPGRAANARAFNTWLLNDWLDGYAHDNVAVFDYYNVLTSNGGDAHTNDYAARPTGNHHYWNSSEITHTQTVANNFLAYPSGDSHPTSAGHRKATAEFVPLLNVFYNRWQSVPMTPTHWLYLPVILKQLSMSPPTPTPTVTPPTVIPSGLIQPSDLAYRGAFTYPAGDAWAYSGHALAYTSSGDPDSTDGYPGSLYVSGHDWDDLVAEITIPAPVVAADVAALPAATVLQPLTDVTGGWMDNCTYAEGCLYREIGGLAYLPNVDKIAWNLRDWYNAARYDQDSLGWSEVDMTGAQGVWHIGARNSEDDVFHNAKTANYLFRAPGAFAAKHLDGKWLIAGNHREAGALGGSQGPTLYALAPWEDGDPPASGQALEAQALLYYPEIYACINDPAQCHFPDYRPKDSWGGGVWVQTSARRGILIFGRKGLGDNCYGTQAECSNDPCDMYKGYHAYPYEPQILFYDPQELTEVLAGTREPWEVLPYETHTVTEVLGGECATLGAATYDEARGLIYVAEQTIGSGGRTAVHVWAVE